MGLEAYSDLTDQLRLQTSDMEGMCSSMLTKGTVTLSPSIKLLTISLHPYYLPWQFQQLFFYFCLHSPTGKYFGSYTADL